MKTYFRILLIAAACLVATAVLITCAPGLGGPSAAATSTGIKLVGPTYRQANSIVPGGFSLDCTGWKVTSAPGDPTVVNATFGLDGGTINNLIPGNYTLTIYALNSTSDKLGENTVPVMVEQGKLTTLHVTVDEYIGDGTASGKLTYEPEVLPPGLPTFVVTMQKTALVYNGTVWVVRAPDTLAFVMNEAACTGTAAPLTLPSGWYEAHGELKDVNGAHSTGFAAAVRIATSHDTLLDLALHAVPTQGGGGFTFTWNGNEELQLTGTPTPSTEQTIYGSDSLAMSVACAADPNITAHWYIDGTLVGSSPAFTLNASALPADDWYRIDCVARSQDGQRASSLTWGVTKGLVNGSLLKIAGHANANGYNPGAEQYVFALMTAASPPVELGRVTVDASIGDFAFINRAPGTYVVKGWKASTPSAWYWWADNDATVKNNESTPPGSHVRITIPLGAPQAFDFPQGF